MWTHILCRVPPCTSMGIKYCDLCVTILYNLTRFHREDVYRSDFDPGLFSQRFVIGNNQVIVELFWPICRTSLTAFSYVFNPIHCFICIYKLNKLLTSYWIVNNSSPLSY